MSDPIKERYNKCGPKVAEALKRRHFDAWYFQNTEDAVSFALTLIPENDSVAWGGSATVDGSGLRELLRARGNRMIDRSEAKTAEERDEIMRRALTADTFLCSSNAITEDGQLVNLDGNGNRVSAMIYGPKSVIVLAGMNKVVKTLADAVSRTRNLAAPTNAQRFGVKTPCQITGECADCTADDCICASLVNIRLSKPAGRIKVLLIGENLGM